MHRINLNFFRELLGKVYLNLSQSSLSSFFKRRAMFYSNGRCENYINDTFKSYLNQHTCTSSATGLILTKLGTKYSWLKGTSGYTNKGLFNSKREIMVIINVVVSSQLCARNCFSVERCGLWASCRYMNIPCNIVHLHINSVLLLLFWVSW